MAHKILIIILVIISIVLSGCSTKLNNSDSNSSSKDEKIDTVEPDLFTPTIPSIKPVTLSAKTLSTDEKNNASIYYDNGFYLIVGDQEYKFKDDYSESCFIIADESEFPRPVFSLYTINNENLYFVVELNTPTNGIGSSAESWYFLYKNNTLELIRQLGPHDVQDMFPEIEFELTGERMIQFEMPGLDKEFKIELGDFNNQINDDKFCFSTITDVTLENNLVVLDCTLVTNEKSAGLARASLVFNINENGIRLIDLINYETRG